MRALAFFKKTFLENLREWKILVLALVFAPFFVYLMYGYFAATAPAYKVLVANHDGGGTSTALVAAWRGAKHPDGKAVFEITEVSDGDAARKRVKDRDADLLVEIPAGFSQSLTAFAERGVPPVLSNVGDQANVRSTMAMAYSDYVAYGYAFGVTGGVPPLDVAFVQVGKTLTLSEFDLYVPALLVLALIMIMFTAAATLIKEVDKKTMSRLMLSRLSTGELLTAVSANQVIIGVAALALAFGSAVSVGYRTDGSLGTLLVVGAVSTLSVVAISVLVAAFLTSMFELLTIGTFPFFILMFFSECMFPLPKVTVAELGGHVLYANDILPTSITVRAFNKVLNHGAGIGDILFEVGSILLLTAGYFVLGTWLFRRRHQRV
jgi:ABC-2 type transport system permease protein